MYRVMKPIHTGGGTLAVGEIVDADSWKNVRALVNMRYLSPVTESAVSAVKAAKPKVEKVKTAEE